jgi:urea transport system ATP-binding protein
MNAHLTDVLHGPQPLDATRRMLGVVTRGAGAPARALGRNQMLHLERLTVSFDGFKALDGLSLYVEPGELRCIIGPNGAGKTTLMDVITGKTRPDSGSAWFGERINLLTLTEPEIAQAGIGRKFQKPTVFEHLTVFENLELALAGRKSFWKVLLARLTPGQREHIDQVLEVIGLTLERTALARTLLLSFAGEHSVMVVEHDMDFVRSIARRVTVLHEGRVLAEGDMNQVQNDPRVVEVYLGE